jgi:hypothetical protein
MIYLKNHDWVKQQALQGDDISKGIRIGGANTII